MSDNPIAEINKTVEEICIKILEQDAALASLRAELVEKQKYILELERAVAALKAENKRLVKWVNDLQSGMYINCVYCGHRYGPDDKVPCTMADALKKHIEKCPKHPMSALKQSLAAAEKREGVVKAYVEDVLIGSSMDYAGQRIIELLGGEK